VTWATKPLAELAGFRLGKMLDERKNRGDFLPYLANVNVRWGEFDLEGLREMRFEHDEIEQYGLTYGDIVMCEGGEPGRCALWKEAVPGMMIQKALHRIRPHACLDNRFLYYSFLHLGSRGAFNPLLTGATIKHLPKEKLAKVEISYPSLGEQGRIADVLSAYDDLIENNRRRMALLQDAARQLYREWFVRLRFPGHEHTRITNGVPEGWARRTLAELCESVDYGYTASADLDEVGPKFLRITDIVSDIIDWTAVPFCPIEEDRMPKFRLVEGDIVIARTGATVGYAKRLHKRHPDAVFASYLVRLRLKPEIDNLMVGIFAESEDYKSYVRSRVGGAAQPNANAKVLSAAKILVPLPSIQRVFHEFVEPLMDQREALQLHNQQLRAARDLLLPRLMSGEISV
jgi:type I restriction enzyme, S subunit